MSLCFNKCAVQARIYLTHFTYLFKTVALNQENNREVLFNKWSEQNPLLAGRAVESPAGGVSISSKMKDRALTLKGGVALAKAKLVHSAAYVI